MVEGVFFIGGLIVGKALVMDHVIDPMQEFILFETIGQAHNKKNK